MKKLALAVVFGIFLTGCSGQDRDLQRGMELRAAVLKAQSCSFDAAVTADYGDAVYTFTMACQGDGQGDLDFTVTAPETLEGITGRITGSGGSLCFEGVALELELLADGQLTPVSAPWILLKTLRGGYLAAAGEEDGLLRLTIDDSYADDALHLDIWLDAGDVPVRGEILYGGRRILTVDVENWSLL